MNKNVTTGAAVIGATGIQDPLATVLVNIAQWSHVAMTDHQATAWSVVILVLVGAIMHRTCIPKDPPPVAVA